MSEVIRKPIDAMSHREKDQLYGEWADLAEERREFAKSAGEEALIEGIYDIVSKCFRSFQQFGVDNVERVLVCHPKYTREATFIASEFKIGLVLDRRMPDNEFFLPEKTAVSALVISRVANKHKNNSNFSSIVLAEKKNSRYL